MENRRLRNWGAIENVGKSEQEVTEKLNRAIALEASCRLKLSDD